MQKTMSKQPIRLGIISNTITPKLRELISKSDEHAQHVMVSMGVALQSWIVQSFTDKAKRIEPWKPKADGTASTLQKSTKLRHSITMRSSSIMLLKLVLIQSMHHIINLV